MTSLPPPQGPVPPQEPQPPQGPSPQLPPPLPPGTAGTPVMAPPPRGPGMQAPAPTESSRPSGRSTGKIVAGVAVVAALAAGGVYLATKDDGDGSTRVTATTVDGSTAVETSDTTTPQTEASTDSVAETTAAPIDSSVDTVATPSDDTALVAGAPPGRSGTLDDPVPAGAIADIGQGWRMQVVDVVADATAELMASDSFIEQPPTGHQYTVVTIALGYFGTDDPQPGYAVSFGLFGANHTELDSPCSYYPETFELYGDYFAGGVMTGTRCFTTTPDDIAALRFFGSATFTDDSGAFLDASTTGKNVAAMTSLVGPQADATATPARTSAKPIGTAADVGGDWTFTVNGPAVDLTDQITADGFSNPPPDGYRFLAVDVTMAYSGSGSASPATANMNAVSDDNVALSSYCGAMAGELDLMGDVVAGGSVTGLICFVAPAAAPMALYVTGEYDQPAVFFATS